MGEAPQTQPGDGAIPETEQPKRRRRRRQHSRSTAGRRQTLRLVYFTIASLWGFLIGTAVLLGGLALAGHPLTLSAPVALALAGAGVASLGGGFVASSAYRQATDGD